MTWVVCVIYDIVLIATNDGAVSIYLFCWVLIRKLYGRRSYVGASLFQLKSIGWKEDKENYSYRMTFIGFVQRATTAAIVGVSKSLLMQTFDASAPFCLAVGGHNRILANLPTQLVCTLALFGGNRRRARSVCVSVWMCWCCVCARVRSWTYGRPTRLRSTT